MKKKLIAVACLASLFCACQQNEAPKNTEMKKMDDVQPPKEQPTSCCKQKDKCCESDKPEAPKETQTVKTESAPESQTVSTPEVKVEAKQ